MRSRDSTRSTTDWAPSGGEWRNPPSLAPRYLHPLLVLHPLSRATPPLAVLHPLSRATPPYLCYIPLAVLHPLSRATPPYLCYTPVPGMPQPVHGARRVRLRLLPLHQRLLGAGLWPLAAACTAAGRRDATASHIRVRSTLLTPPWHATMHPHDPTTILLRIRVYELHVSPPVVLCAALCAALYSPGPLGAATLLRHLVPT